MGLMGAKPTVDWAKMLDYKDDVVNGNTKGIEFLFKKNKVTWLKGWGRSRRRAGQGRRRASQRQEHRHRHRVRSLEPARRHGG
jgi:pyruvate/2-oxoglutarate dehydrogenase complex dihydrolipoamide dehydrogenase (E3) component